MALFSFQRRGEVVVVLHFLVRLIGTLVTLPVLATFRPVHAIANVPISEPDLKFILLPSSNRIIAQKNGTELLPCLVSIKNEIVYSPPDFEYPFHVWLRNNEPIVATRKNEFQIFANGTLKILSGEKAAGSYRCLVNGTEIDAGILLSNETIVRSAVFKRIRFPSDLNVTAIIGQPTVLQCPILSVPNANVTWFFGNKNTNTIGNRFLILENGGLLIKNTTRLDQGKFKCLAKNNYAPKPRQIVWTVSIQEQAFDEFRQHDGLLEQLQNDTVFVETGKRLRLHCASYNGAIDWWFIPRSFANHSILIQNQSVELLVEHTTVETHDGWYKCATKFDYQIFNVIITTPPRILIPLENWESSVSAQASFNCHATGNPPPSITWYRNGVLLENDLRIHLTAQTLYINSIDLDEGIYQCFAKNPAGEAFSAGRLTLRRKDEISNMPGRPTKISCYPVNYETIFVTFDGSSSLAFITPHMVTRDPFNWTTIIPIRLTSTPKFEMSRVPVFKPFTLFLRGMVPTSTQKTVNGEVHTFDTSLLSEGVLCSTQGMRVNTVFLPSGIFLFWTPMDIVKAKYFRLQLRSNNSKNALLFGDTIVGTTNSIDLQRTTKEDINAWLFKMPIVDKVVLGDETGDIRTKRSINGGGSGLSGKQSFENSHKSEKSDKESSEGGAGITEIRISGNATGVLIPNIQTIEARVLIVTADNENIKQDLRFLEWETITLEETVDETAVVHTNHNFLFRVASIESRSITISWNPAKLISCLKVCYFINMLEAKIRQNNQNNCKDIHDVGMYFTIRKLMPSTTYHVSLIDCKASQQFGMMDIKTLADAPGPITNQKVLRKDGFVLSWDPPINPNGEIIYYNIKWTVLNSTFSANVTEGANIFKFPNITEEDKVNITIRAVGTSGVGLPIYMDFKYIMTPNLGSGTRSFSDPILGITVGIVLSLMCILIFIWIFVVQRKRFKSRGCAQNSSSSPTDSHCPQTSASNIELREMQTLIPKSGGLHIVSDGTNVLPRNGMYYSENDEETETAENLRNISKVICTSTPKATRRAEKYGPLSERLLEEYDLTPMVAQATNAVAQELATIVDATPAQHSTDEANSKTAPIKIDDDNIATTPTITPLDKNSSSPNFYISKLHSNGNSTRLQNGSIKTTLPPNKHSMQAATSDPKLIKANGSLKSTNRSQYSTDPNLNASTNLDNSRHKLLDSKIDSRSTISQLNDTKNHRNNNHRPPIQHQQHLALCHPQKQTNNHHPRVTLNDSDDKATTAIDLNDSIRSLNSSSSSCNPLLKSASWNYRRPIVEPNG